MERQTTDWPVRVRAGRSPGVALVVLGGLLGLAWAAGIRGFTPQRFDHPQLTGLDGLVARLGADLPRVQRATAGASSSLEAEPVPHGAHEITCFVPPDPRAVRHARRFVQSTLAAWGVDDDMIDNAALCLSELVTNAVIHTDAGCDLRVVLDRGVLTTTVRDGGSSVVVDPTHVTVDPLDVHGRGLQLVDACSTRWGSEPRGRDDRVVRARAREGAHWSIAARQGP